MQRRPRGTSDERALPARPRPVLPWLGDPVSKSTTESTDAEAPAASSTASSEASETARSPPQTSSTHAASAHAASTNAASTNATSTQSSTAGSSSRTRTTRRDPFALDDLLSTSEPAHDVVVANHSEERHEVTVLVTGHARRDVRHAGTHVVAPDAERVLFDTSELDPDGIETFHVVVETNAHAIDSRLRTNECSGDLRVVVRDDGDLHAVRSIT